MNDQICPTQKGRNLGFFAYQCLLENMGLIEKSSVTAYLDKYYEEHPLDNSYEGILARRSGLTKEQVVAYLDKLDYLAKVVDYDPTNKAQYLNKRHRSHIDSIDSESYISNKPFYSLDIKRSYNITA